MATLNKISANASAGVWEYVENIPTEIIHVADYSQQQEQLLIKPVEPKQPLCEGVTIEGHSGMKTWMPHNLFGEDTLQYAVQQLAVTDKDGFRGVNGRMCVAVGTGVGAGVGQLIDIILANGEIIPAIIGDIKSPEDTNSDNITTTFSGCVCEFIVERDKLNETVKFSGDVSSLNPSFDSPIVEIIVYTELNVLQE